MTTPQAAAPMSLRLSSVPRSTVTVGSDNFRPPQPHRSLLPLFHPENTKMTHPRPQHEQPNPKRSARRPWPLMLASLSLVLTFCHNPARGSSITYNLESYLPLQNGYTLSGTITTDGTIGTLTSSDITAWSFTITQGSVEIVTPFQPPRNPSPGHRPDRDRISAHPPHPPRGLERHHHHRPSARSTHGPHLLRLLGPRIRQRNPRYGDVYGEHCRVLWVPHGTTPPAPLPGLSLGGTNPWIIATTAAVPEPGSLTLALLGTAFLAVGGWTRRRNRAASRIQPSPTAQS